MAEVVRTAGVILLALTFLWAAVAKLRSLPATRAEFASIGIRVPALTVPLVIASELACVVLVVARPRLGALAAILLLVSFSTVLVGVIRSGRVVSCACFGATSSKPVDRAALIRNGLLCAVALAVVLVSP